MVGGTARVKEIEDNVDNRSLSTDKHFKETAKVANNIFRAVGRMFEQEANLRAVSGTRACSGNGTTGSSLGR
jgi:hypothetical protein